MDIKGLEQRRDALLADVAKLEAILAAFGQAPARLNGRAGRGRRGEGGRGSNSQTLAAALVKTLRGKTMSVTEAADAVQRDGYKTSSPNFRTIVNAALLSKKNRDLFKRKGRGQYTAAH